MSDSFNWVRGHLKKKLDRTVEWMKEKPKTSRDFWSIIRYQPWETVDVKGKHRLQLEPHYCYRTCKRIIITKNKSNNNARANCQRSLRVRQIIFQGKQKNEMNVVFLCICFINMSYLQAIEYLLYFNWTLSCVCAPLERFLVNKTLTKTRIESIDRQHGRIE